MLAEKIQKQEFLQMSTKFKLNVELYTKTNFKYYTQRLYCNTLAESSKRRENGAEFFVSLSEKLLFLLGVAI